jgi:hypothetical protein
VPCPSLAQLNTNRQTQPPSWMEEAFHRSAAPGLVNHWGNSSHHDKALHRPTLWSWPFLLWLFHQWSLQSF